MTITRSNSAVDTSEGQTRPVVNLTSHVAASGSPRVFTVQHEHYQPASGPSPIEAARAFIRTNRLKPDPELD